MYQLNQLLENMEGVFPILSIAISIFSLIIVLLLIFKTRKQGLSEKRLGTINDRLNSIEKIILEKISKKELNELKSNLVSLDERVKNLESKVIEEGETRPVSQPILARRQLVRGVTVAPPSFQRYISSNPLLSSGVIFDSSGMIIEIAGIDFDKGEKVASYMYEVIRNSRETLTEPKIILFQGDNEYGILLKLSEIEGTEIFAFLNSRIQPSFTQCFVIKDALKKYVEKTFKRGVKNGE